MTQQPKDMGKKVYSAPFVTVLRMETASVIAASLKPDPENPDNNLEGTTDGPEGGNAWNEGI